jgi:TonB family protein
VTPYLLLSAAVHAAVIAGLIFGLSAVKPEKKYYAVDFMGGQSGLGTGRLQPAPAPAGGHAENAEAPKLETPEDAPDTRDERKLTVKKENKKGKGDKKKKHGEGTLKAPRNKGAKGGRGESADGKGDIMGAKSGAVGGAGTSLEIGGFGPGGVQAGPRFPYSWYVNSLYKRLWEAWDRTDAGNKSCGVAFTILRDGTVKEIKVDDTSGDAFFDITARRAVEDAAPFSPLPEGFPEKELRVYVKFRLQ